jgi:hypothetical protein
VNPLPDLNISEIHAKLFDFFQRLRASRDGRPVFALEYLGTGISREDVFVATRAAIQQTPITQTVWWGSRFLPLLVAATEVGYKYRGNGTTYWPELASSLGVEFTNDARRCVRDLFMYSANKLGFAEPKPSPWVDQFSYISWPISHAILPEYMQERFAQALILLGVKVESLNDGEEAAAAFLETLTENDLATRFGALLRDSQLSATLALAILGSPADSWLNAGATDRIKRDLERSRYAQASVEAARLRQRELKAQSHHAVNVIVPADVPPALVLVEGNADRREHPYLSIRFPISARDVASRIIEDPRTRFFAPSLWSIVAPIRIDALLCGQVVPLRLENLPPPSTPLFADFDPDLLANNAFRYLQGCDIDLQRPLLFGGAEEQDLELLIRFTGGNVPARVVVIDEANEWGSCKKQSLGTLCGLPVYELDLTVGDTVKRLTELGLHAARSLKIGVGGTPPLESPSSNEYEAGDVIAFTVEGQFNTLQYDGVNVGLEAGQNGTVGVTADPAGHAFTASCVDGASVTRTFRAAPIEVCEPLVEIEWHGEATTDALLHRTPFGIHIRSSLALASIYVTVSLTTDSLCRVERCVVPMLPITLTERHEVWDRLVPPTIADDLTSAHAATLEISVGGLRHAAFHMHKKTSTYWWTNQPDQGGWRCETDGGPVDYLVSEEKSPLDSKLGITNAEASGIVLFLPRRPLREIGDGLCEGGKEQAFAPPSPVRPRFIRQVEDTSNGVGLQRLFTTYLNWTLARAANTAVNFRRRALAAVLDNWTAVAVCGESWATAEHAIPAFCPAFSDRLATSLCGEDYRTLAAEIRRSWSDIELWASQLRPTPLATPAFINHTLRDAVSHYADREGRCSIAVQQRLDGIDVSQLASEWKAQTELHQLLATVWPTSGQGALASLPYSEPALALISLSLHRWHQEFRDGHMSPRWDKSSIQDALAIWLNPSAFRENQRWGVLSLLRDDMGMARAIRYAVLRLRFARS